MVFVDNKYIPHVFGKCPIAPRHDWTHLKGLITRKWLDQTRKRNLASSEVEVLDKNKSSKVECLKLGSSFITYRDIPPSHAKLF